MRRRRLSIVYIYFVLVFIYALVHSFLQSALLLTVGNDLGSFTNPFLQVFRVFKLSESTFILDPLGAQKHKDSYGAHLRKLGGDESEYYGLVPGNMS